ncbi:Anaphase-promoting complex subunit 4 [Nakaseomyces glabratus]|nr:Anaphase-promoting complex subunit 4 [Nakaseomyces glabratus]KTB26775.1 Anaphase-promoting complex subunit 4 [Nakaseomyces glabratus]OXB45128.1 hypothetical protein B1J91_B01859g [Nakaseomyces glabratus]OXB50425.1 hypothetical protein B1J92_B01859g [Nakaseomyces glabratus]
MGEDIVLDRFLKYNPKYGLFGMNEDNHSLVIKRTSDNVGIVKINVRNIVLLLDYFWDPIDGKYLALFLKDGSVRIYDIFNGGKLISFLRVLPVVLGSNKPSLDCCLWDRIIIPKSGSSELRIPNNDLTESMPTLVKFVQDAKQIDIIPNRSITKLWRSIGNNEKKVVDVHLGYSCSSAQVTILINGEYLIEKSVSDINQIQKKMPISLNKKECCEAIYEIHFDDYSRLQIDLTGILLNDDKLDLIETQIKITNHFDLIKDHFNLIEKLVLAPYYEFLESIGGINDLDVLERLFLIGELDTKLGNWFKETINEKNLKKWSRLGNEFYSNFKQILIIVFVPICERLMVLTNRINGMIKGIDLQESQETSLLDISELQSFLNLVLKLLAELNEDETYFKQDFLPWLTDKVYESINNEYKSVFFKAEYGNNKRILNIIKYFEATVIEIDYSLRTQLNKLKDENEKIINLFQKFSKSSLKTCLSEFETKLFEPKKAVKLLACEKICNDVCNYVQVLMSKDYILEILLVDAVTGTVLLSEKYNSIQNPFGYEITLDNIISCTLVGTEKVNKDDTYMQDILAGGNSLVQENDDKIEIYAVFGTALDVDIENIIQVKLHPPKISLKLRTA